MPTGETSPNHSDNIRIINPCFQDDRTNTVNNHDSLLVSLSNGLNESVTIVPKI